MKFNESLIDMNEPQIGDYVICEDESIFREINDKFISNNVGRIVDIADISDNKLSYTIVYDNVPLEMKHFFEMSDFPNSRRFSKREIRHFSSDRKDMEAILATRKYNL